MKTDIHFLLVEDDEISTFVTSSTLQDMGFNSIDVVDNGMEAISFMQETCPDIILLDLNMPVMNGFEFLAKVNIDTHCSHTQIVVLTSSNRDKDMKLAHSFNNILGYIEKPLSIQKMNDVLKELNAA